MESSSELSAFYQTLKPVFLFTKCLGIFPFKFPNNVREVLISERKEIFLPTIWFFFSLAAACYLLTAYICDETMEKPLKVVYILYFCFLSVTSLNSFIAIWIHKTNVKDIFRNLIEVDQLLDKNTALVLYKHSRLFFVKSVAFVLLFLSIASACSFYYHYSILDDTMSAICEITMNVINVMLIFQYVIFVQAIQVRYCGLWKKLKSLCKENKVAVSPQMYLDNISDTTRICVLRQQHFRLSNVVSLLNQVYGFAMLLEIITALSNCIGSLYEGIYIINQEGDSIMCACVILAGASLFLPLLWMVMWCHLVVQENGKQMTAIQELLICRSVNYSTQEELKELFLQIKFMEPNFSAGGFFTLNLQFICSCFSSMFTYIVIMSQMK
ncbi:hypothetical protein L9F63_015715 [Diploptera punctata]|uniref:Gustatory receptor n=1 Tax=Diploptera punctata TaxID=6984 RepID=A0AAD8EJV4_DIPPU|nr:hypothetical protein L9F63_015715 [Diploptera punctata]